jgi:type VI protein secretion system component Hcp
MPILMKYAGVSGESQLNGKTGFLEIESLSWGVSRSMAGVKAGARGDADCRVEEVELSRKMDSCSASLLKEALLGRFDRKVEIHLARTGQNKLRAYAVYEFENCGISAYSTSAAGDVPQEQLRLNFTKVLFKAFKVDDDLSAVPDTAHYDLVQGTGG